MEKAARRKKISKIIYVIGMLGVIMLNIWHGEAESSATGISTIFFRYG